eukprot:767726-Hanusia_phi.AAC.8
MKCNECMEALDASYQCMDCGLLLCDECHRHHRKSKRSSSHSTIPLPTSDVPVTPRAQSQSAESSPQEVRARFARKLMGLRPKQVIDIDAVTGDAKRSVASR